MVPKTLPTASPSIVYSRADGLQGAAIDADCSLFIGYHICQPKKLRSTCKCLFVSAAQELLNDLAELASVPLSRWIIDRIWSIMRVNSNFVLSLPAHNLYPALSKQRSEQLGLSLNTCGRAYDNLPRPNLRVDCG